jgi:molecular chaperone GrpE
MGRKKEKGKKKDEATEAATPATAVSDEEKTKAATGMESEAGREAARATDPEEDAVAKVEAEETAQEFSEEEKLRVKSEETEDKYLRLAAEFENYKKRMARQCEEIVRTANDRILFDLLDVVDSFERALEHPDNSDYDSFRKGTELILNQIKDLLARREVTPIEAIGNLFDPNLHEAMMQVASDEHGEGTVAIEISRGYRQGNRVLRHSKVGVSKGKVKAEDSEIEEARNE